MENNSDITKNGNFRKAFLVPFMFGITAMSAIFIFGGSVADKMILKNRYYQIKDFTDKLAIAAGNIYQSELNTVTAEAKAFSVMSSHPLYNELFNSTTLVWNLSSSTVVANVQNYNFDTFWLRFIDLSSINIEEVNSTAQLVSNGGATSKYKTASALKPIAINDQNLSVGTSKTFRFKIASLWDYTEKDTFYGLDMFAVNDNYHGADQVILYRNELSDEEPDYKLNVCDDDDGHDSDGDGDDDDCDYEDGDEKNVTLLGDYLGTYTSNNGVDVTNTVKGLEDYTGYFNGNPPVNYEAKEISVALLGSDESIVGFMNLSIDSLNYVDTGSGESRWIEMTATVLGKPKTKLID